LRCREILAHSGPASRHRSSGGRARSAAAPYIADDGTHVFYSDGEPWPWMAARGPVRPFRRPTLGEIARSRFRYGGRLALTPPWPLVSAPQYPLPAATSLAAARAAA
jgi:hypothetical protein